MSLDSKSDETVNTVPIANGLFRLPGEGSPEGYLIGGKCRVCGRIFFPKPYVCFSCQIFDTMDEKPLSTKGKLWSFSKSAYAIPDSPLKEVPWVGGIIELPEGVYVRARIAGISPDEVTQDHLDTEMKLQFRTFGTDEQGNEIITFEFAFV